jgi:glycerophosphoryl diester phosphodiesterase
MGPLRLLVLFMLFIVTISTIMLFLGTFMLVYRGKGSSNTVTLPMGFKRHGLTRESLLAFAHRGGCRLFPENTLFAFESSYRLGADVLDLDVRSTKDLQIVAVHDENVLEVSNVSRNVQDMTFDELSKLDFGFSWTFDNHFDLGDTTPYRGIGIKVMKLETLFARFAQNPKVLFNIELKIPGLGFVGVDKPLVHGVCQLIRRYSMEKRVIIMSFSDSAWLYFRQHCPEIPTAPGPFGMLPLLLFSSIGISPPSFLVPYSAIQPPAAVTTKNLVDVSHRLGLGLHVWTVNVPGEMDDLLQLGVDGIMSDRLDVLLDVAGHRGKGSIIGSETIDPIPTGKVCQAKGTLFAEIVQPGCNLLQQASPI